MLDSKTDKYAGGKADTDGSRPGPPALSLPKGGGAIRGMGEKFAANPVTGTGSLSVPIAVSPGRSGFSPQLTLSYDSGAGNGPFGLGWNLSLPAITRKTDKGLPQYRDAEESDVFILSGAEDLVPVLAEGGMRWQDERHVVGVAYRIHRYKPRIEGLFARIERWTNLDTGEIHWRSITRDNITTLYGKDNNSRIFDPEDPDLKHPTRIFSWLTCESYDDKGNVVVYEYKGEDTTGVGASDAHEANRTIAGRSANRYLKHVHYGNRTPYFPSLQPVQPPTPLPSDWMFELVFDYGEHDADDPAPGDGSDWLRRFDPFSTFRAGFEVRTYRLCRRVLMFHHFPDELGVDDYLVRSTEFTYAESRIASFITSVSQSGYVRRDDGSYLKKSLPPLEFEYSRAVLQEEVREIDAESLENLPYGLDGTQYQWVDLDGEGISGILTEQAEGWFYKRNLSPAPVKGANGEAFVEARFAQVELVARKPSPVDLDGGRQQFLDLAGDGQIDLVQLRRPFPGYFERTHDGDWDNFVPFESVPNVGWDDPNLKMVDLTGDGHADVLISENEVFTWYPSLAEAGFGPAETVRQVLDEEKGPRLVFADGTHSIYLADLSGDGLTDLVRIRNGEVSYWPNRGYGRFGAKVTMDDAPWFDAPDLFDQTRIRLADIDGSGVTDVLYMGRDVVDVYLNESGNSWSARKRLAVFPQVDDLSAVTAVDLLGNGTACLVWSSSLPGDAQRPMRYIDLMGGQKPHLLVKTINNLGAETHVHYAPSTKFYLEDKLAGRPWITRLPFPVHVVERVETRDRISRNRFATRYAYHHGYFDGPEREFRGFGMVEQWDTEAYATLSAGGEESDAVNIDAASHVPPVLTRTWFHTGAGVGGERISRLFEDEYYREGDPSLGEGTLTDAQVQAMLLRDTVMPDPGQLPELTTDEMREARRSLKGAVLRQEIYALDDSEASDRPYRVSERNYTIRRLQPRGPNRHAVFFTHDRETIDFHYERALYTIGDDLRADPRVSHAMTLDVDEFGNTLKSVAVGYGRRYDDPDPLLTVEDREKQGRTLSTYTENDYTNAVQEDDAYRVPLLSETRTYELLNVTPEANQLHVTNLFRFGELADKLQQAGDGDHDLPYEDLDGAGATDNHPYRRLIEHVRKQYRRDDLTGPLPVGELQSMALPFESYKLALTPGLVQEVYIAGGKMTASQFETVASDEGGYVHSEGDANWWIPAGQIFYSPNETDTPAQELDFARQHFFLPQRFRDPFGATTTTRFDVHDLLLVETEDALHNKVTAGERDADDNLIAQAINYRVLQPGLVTGPNRNHTAVSFDALGLVAGTAVMGKPEANEGDTLDGFVTDLDDATLLDHIQNPLADPHAILQDATTRLVHDVLAYHRTRNEDQPQPAVVYVLARETHLDDLEPGEQADVQQSFSYSDGFGREIQQKIQAEPGPLDVGGPLVSPRWVGSGWIIFNNKGKPVRQYEPFFDDTHDFRYGKTVGVGPLLCYDPVERVVAILHPNHTWEKVVFDPWRQVTWDVNDTVLQAHPHADPDVGNFFHRLSEDEYMPTWHALRTDPVHAADANKRWSDSKIRQAEKRAAEITSVHAATPAVAYADSLGRTFLTVAHNRLMDDGNSIEERPATRIRLDIEGNQRDVIDAKNRVVMRYDYDLHGSRIYQASVDAGERWMLVDMGGAPIRAWDKQGHTFRTTYDALRRPTHLYVQPEDETGMLAERTVYGEVHPEAPARNLKGKLYLQYDGAGMISNGQYDFKGNLVGSHRRLAKEYTLRIDWSALDGQSDLLTLTDAAEPLLESETFSASTSYDALNRPTSLTTPDASEILPTYNKAGLLEQFAVRMRGAATATPFVENIDYDAKGQRERIDYSNGVQTTYTYDDETLSLIRLRTTREMGDGPLQDLYYTYDPAGNATTIKDDAQQTIFFNNTVVEPHADYTYDALYRLIKATGREHIGQASNNLPGHLPHLKPHYDFSDSTRRNLPHPHDGQAMRRYIRRYEYDVVGNILAMIHQGNGGSWTRRYDYAPDSNRLLATSLPGDLDDGPYSAKYEHDVHGNMTRMPHLEDIQWDFEDHMQQVDLGGGGTVYFVYDAAGERVRKVHQHNGSTVEERIYLGSYEVYRKRKNGNVELERETLHVMDDARRIALVEAKTHHEGSEVTLPASVIRYQLSNHLDSSALEVDDNGQVISYEEYHPYGTTSYQARVSAVEVSLKRYRYTGKERDDETGLCYHGARYYAPWLGRWTTADPAGLEEGLNMYLYVFSNPLQFIDPDGKQPQIITKAAERALKQISRRGLTGHGKKHVLGGWTEWVRMARRAGKRKGDWKSFKLYWQEHKSKTKLKNPLHEKKLVIGTLKKFDPENTFIEGKRVVFQRAFGKEVGHEGEKLFRVVVDIRTGMIKTYFAQHVFKTIAAGGAAALLTLESGIAEAAAQGQKEREAYYEQYEKGTSETTSDWINPIMELSEGQDLLFEPSPERVYKLADRLIERLENQLQKSLGEAERAEIRGAVWRAYTGEADTSHLRLDVPEELLHSMREDFKREQARIEWEQRERLRQGEAGASGAGPGPPY